MVTRVQQPHEFGVVEGDRSGTVTDKLQNSVQAFDAVTAQNTRQRIGEMTLKGPSDSLPLISLNYDKAPPYALDYKVFGIDLDDALGLKGGNIEQAIKTLSAIKLDSPERFNQLNAQFLNQNMPYETADYIRRQVEKGQYDVALERSGDPLIKALDLPAGSNTEAVIAELARIKRSKPDQYNDLQQNFLDRNMRSDVATYIENRVASYDFDQEFARWGGPLKDELYLPSDASIDDAAKALNQVKMFAPEQFESLNSRYLQSNMSAETAAYIRERMKVVGLY